MAHVRDCHFRDSSIERGTECRGDSERGTKRGTGTGTDQANHKHKQKDDQHRSELFVCVCVPVVVSSSYFFFCFLLFQAVSPVSAAMEGEQLKDKEEWQIDISEGRLLSFVAVVLGVGCPLCPSHCHHHYSV